MREYLRIILIQILIIWLSGSFIALDCCWFVDVASIAMSRPEFRGLSLIALFTFAAMSWFVLVALKFKEQIND